MAIETVIAGQYTPTYNAVAMGFTQRGWEITQETKAELVNESDAYGDSILDMVHRGGNVFAMGDCRIFKAGSMTPFYPWGALGVMFTAAAPIGRLASAVAAAFVLTSVAATPSVATPASLTASKAILPPDSNLKLLYDSRCRNVPIKLQFLPSETGGNGTWYATT